MNKFATTTVEDEREKFVREGMKACRSTITFPLGENEAECYSYTDPKGNYSSWGNCTLDGDFVCFSDWGGIPLIGKCNLFDFSDIIKALEKKDKFSEDLERFLSQQIEKVKSM